MAVRLDAGTGGKKRSLQPNINVTPLVDVVLVLLIIFMVVLPNMQDAKTIEMVQVKTAPKTAWEGEEILVTLARDGCYFGEQKMPREALLSLLQQKSKTSPDARVLLRGDAGLPYEDIRAWLKDAQDLGITGIALAVQMAKGNHASPH